MHRIIQGVLPLFFLVLMNSSAARDFPGVKELMKEQEFAAAGLNKLSAEELKALDGWLLRYTMDDVPELIEEVPELKESVELRAAVTPEPKPRPEPEPEPEKIVSKIKGEFIGWRGKTIFKLENGQIWKQRQSGRYYHKMENPEISISKNMMGFYMMEIVETGKRIGVRRLR